MVNARVHDYGLELTLCRARHKVSYSVCTIILSSALDCLSSRQVTQKLLGIITTPTIASETLEADHRVEKFRTYCQAS